MPTDRQLAVKEMKRILKPNGKAYISLGAPHPPGYMSGAEWEQTLAGFRVKKRGGSFEKWAVVFPK
jgi:ubiquinone/menaquinone biosynthesis C-methylase UbiE